MMRAIAAGDVDTVVKLPGRSTGAVRKCLLRVAKPQMAEYRRRLQVEVVQLRDLPRKPHIYGRAQPDFLGMFKGLSGKVAPVDVWACSRTGLYWEKLEADAFAAVNTRPRHHEPVPLDYRHHAKTVLGLSRRWTLDNDGALHGMFDMGSHPPAQHAARAAQRGDLGLSMSVRFRTRWLAQVAPDDWDPVAGDLTCVSVTRPVSKRWR